MTINRRFWRGTEKYLSTPSFSPQVFQGKKTGDKILRIRIVSYQYKEKEPSRVQRQPNGKVKSVVSAEDHRKGKKTNRSGSFSVIHQNWVNVN